MLQNPNGDKGSLLVEILIAVGILSTVAFGFFSLVALSLRITNISENTLLAENLAKESIEIVRAYRDSTDWGEEGLGSLSFNEPYYPREKEIGSSQWELVKGEEELGNFSRKIVFEKVFRDPEDNISETGEEDSDTLKVRSIVSFSDREVEIITYLTNWK